MHKRISIIGGGISGLAVLHYLKQRFGDDADISLFEKEASAGGTVRSLKKDSFLFEWGPDGFLDNQPVTLELIAQLGLEDRLIGARPEAATRYIQIEGRLYPVPLDPVGLMRSRLLSSHDKWSLIKGLFKRNISTDVSIYDYVSRRFSCGIAEALVDPFISGIYAGDIRRLHMSAFPKFKGRKFKKSRMCSFKGGMGEIIEALADRYKNCIQTSSPVASIPPDMDITVVATPAYAAARIVKNVNPDLAQILGLFPYAPVAVAGLAFKRDSFKKIPDGFGYLVPSKEHKEILGVLIESNVYSHRAPEGHVMLRVILGGMHHPQTINDAQERVLVKAVKEIDSVYGLVSNPIEGFVKFWPQAIPQYEINYPQNRRSIALECAKTPGLHLCANYLDGISFNDCIAAARSLALAI
ncbi:MAG: protoporphyrinogen oxidase [Candidatus Omnitrophica bacterium]|nr:protoporphyrinogen oxidase [Candidatus Omnitrophota bacterium]MDE2009701.1 protoporphyrinogen oxidase [Candidatus Omnitrophota bacterium]MDE2213902.1 protoporphyrinogen oxidase [Candidatus Omnitrophota bacterium]MDE2231839.1 protoporphyrinogen oxidase [Candidatus Omnitrophota bacterium]